MTAAKKVADSAVTLHQLMMPEHANTMGNVHGGLVMKLADEAAGICAMRHAQRPAVTIAMDSMTFYSPVKVGNLITLNAMLTYIGRTSMEIQVNVTAENPITGERVRTNSAYLVYVALDDDGRPTPVPGLILETPREHERWEEGKARQAHRLAQQAKLKPEPGETL